MPMTYDYTAIPDAAVPRASSAVFQHLLDTYAGETNKVITVWREFSPLGMSFRPHPRSSTVHEIFKHQLLSERRFFGEFLGLPEPPAAQVEPEDQTPEGCIPAGARRDDLLKLCCELALSDRISRISALNPS